MKNKTSPIAVFDSGMGGISVLKAVTRLLPSETFLYFGDSENAPYGEKTKEEVLELSSKWFDYFLSKDIKAVVIACNTATSAAANNLREKYPELPIIGIEPAIKPAALYDYSGEKKEKRKIIVMATPLTLREAKYLNLVAQYGDYAEFIPLGAPELVKYVETGRAESPEAIEYLENLLSPYKGGDIDAIVLGCTHFPFAKASIMKVMGKGIVFFDGSEGAARELKRRLEALEMLAPPSCKGSIIFENSDENFAKLELSKILYETVIPDDF